MELHKIIDSIILEIYLQMPSLGTWPFTIIHINRDELSGLQMDKNLFAPFQLLVLKRTHFNSEDLLDYVMKSNEYQTVEDGLKNKFLEKYYKMIADENEFQQWIDRTTSLAIGLVIQKGLQRGLQFSPIKTDFSALNTHMGLEQKKLSAYQLFDVHPIDPSLLI